MYYNRDEENSTKILPLFFRLGFCKWYDIDGGGSIADSKKVMSK